MSGFKDLMGDQPYDLNAFARRTDPETSHEAARAISDKVSNLEGIALNAIKSNSLRGLTNEELVNWTKIEWKTITPRIKPLREKGLVEARLNKDGQIIKRDGVSGRPQVVWFPTAKALG